MKLWIDDSRPAPNGYRWARSVDEAIDIIEDFERYREMRRLFPDAEIELIDISCDNRNFVKVLVYLDKSMAVYPIRIHGQNMVGRQSMRAIIHVNGWQEIY